MTLNFATLLKSSYNFTIVSRPTKANAIYHTLNTEIHEYYRSTILRAHPKGVLYIDMDSTAKH